MRLRLHSSNRYSGGSRNLLAALKPIPAFAGMTVLVFSLAACSRSSLTMEKLEPQPVAQDSIIRPPWETLVKAGPGAEKDIDLETLNGPQAAPADLTAAAPPPQQPEVSAPARPEKPGAIAIKAVAVLAVDGASAQANKELTLAMRKVLKEAGWPVLTAPRKDALAIRGHVELGAALGANQAVHISWQVASPKGKELGKVDQNNQVAAHSLDGAWGKTAALAAQAAADGLFKLIAGYR